MVLPLVHSILALDRTLAFTGAFERLSLASINMEYRTLLWRVGFMGAAG